MGTENRSISLFNIKSKKIKKVSNIKWYFFIFYFYLKTQKEGTFFVPTNHFPKYIKEPIIYWGRERDMEVPMRFCRGTCIWN
jgi:hypothetical protein